MNELLNTVELILSSIFGIILLYWLIRALLQKKKTETEKPEERICPNCSSNETQIIKAGIFHCLCCGSSFSDDDIDKHHIEILSEEII